MTRGHGDRQGEEGDVGNRSQKTRSLASQSGCQPATKWGRPPQPSHPPNGESKMGQLDTACWQRESTDNWPDHWPPGLSGFAANRTTSFRRNERDSTGTFPRSNSCTWFFFLDHRRRRRCRASCLSALAASPRLQLNGVDPGPKGCQVQSPCGHGGNVPHVP